MKAAAVLVCLFLGSQDDAGWAEKLRSIRPSWGRKELAAFLETVRFPVAHRPDVLTGGVFASGNRLTFYEVFSLDRTTSLYVVWNSEDSTRGLRSTETVRFTDLKDRIEADLFDAVSAIQGSPS